MMIENMSLIELLKVFATCDGDKAIEIVSRFQSGGLKIEDMSVEDLPD